MRKALLAAAAIAALASASATAQTTTKDSPQNGTSRRQDEHARRSQLGEPSYGSGKH